MKAAAGLAAGDRVLFLGLGPRGQHGDVLSIVGRAGRACAAVRFDSGCAMLTLRADLHPIPRRPKPIW